MHIENIYTSSNCNQTPTIVDWGKNNLICYGSCNAIMIYDSNIGSGGKVVNTLTTHKQRVNTVKWISGIDQETEFVSGSTDNTLIVWSLTEQTYKPTILTGHNDLINIVDGLYKSPNQTDTVVASVSMDNTVRIWYRKLLGEDFILQQTLDYSYSVCVGMRLYKSVHGLMLACGLDNSNINVYLEKSEFVHQNTLKGHEDWVRGLDFTTDGNDVLLASASQDFYIRIWRFKSENLEMTLDSVLIGHEGWIYSIQWHPKKLQLLSASLDKSMIIWSLESDSKLWLENARLGEVGGDTLGFYGGIYGPDGASILGHSYHGAFHLWRYRNATWQPAVTIGGHFNAVCDLAWDPKGSYLLSVSSDQTARIHAPYITEKTPITWHEIARPQIHGYDFGTLAILSRYNYASAAEEKVIRIFEAPDTFHENLCNISGVQDNSVGTGMKGASVPALGLTNKAMYSDDNSEDLTGNKKGYLEEIPFRRVTMQEPPTEEHLLENTLWPEVQKLYGHGYEVYALAASPDAQFLASACKATTPEHAAILLWDTTEWRQIQKLYSHTLTVVQMCFSPDSRRLLSVSRDRRWSIFELKSGTFELIATTDKKTAIHTRIIWCCDWTNDGKYFATGSRDGKIVIWGDNPEKTPSNCLGHYEKISHHELNSQSITSVSFAPNQIASKYLIAIGLENGTINGYGWQQDHWLNFFVLNQNQAHHLTVKRLAFRPANQENVIQLASCGTDNTVRIYDIYLE